MDSSDKIFSPEDDVKVEKAFEEKKLKRKEFWSWVIHLVLMVIIVLLIKKFLFGSVLIEGRSMTPTFNNKDQVFTKQSMLVGNKYRHGDVIVFTPPEGYREKGYFIKRIIGLPGDRIEFKGGQVIRNGDILEENYISTPITSPVEETSYEVPEGHVFVLGDNREPGGSLDGRVFGTFPMTDIQGVVVFRYWPFTNFGVIPRGE